MAGPDRAQLLPEHELPRGVDLVAEGERLARTFTVGSCPFLDHHHVSSESEYKRRRMADGTLMFHAQVGYRNLEHSRRAYGEIYERLDVAGRWIDRYGICLDWSMGYPAHRRAGMPRGTGLTLDRPEDFSALTSVAPVAPHFGDFVIGTPAAVENTVASLAAGGTIIGNLGQYFTFRMPRWHDDIFTTAETVKAIALCAAQPVEVLIHSNLDDGFASLFTDLACGIGMVLIERHIIEGLLGGRTTHCYGHTFEDPLTRLAFQRALARVTDAPGSMIYGNTTSFGAGIVANYANLAAYLAVDIAGQRAQPTGHALNPVPVTEAMRIPEISEIVDAHLFANQLADRTAGYAQFFDLDAVDRVADSLVDGGVRFRDAVLAGLADAGIDTTDAFELLLSLRRLGARRLEELFGPGSLTPGQPRGRTPVVMATTVAALESKGSALVSRIDPADLELIRNAHFKVCSACTDVHEYGKLLVEATLRASGVDIVDAGVSADPDAVAECAASSGADFIAISTYNGVAVPYLRAVRRGLKQAALEIPVFVGGKLNEVPDDGPDSMPRDVSDGLRELGAFVCTRVEDMLEELARMASGRRFGS